MLRGCQNYIEIITYIFVIVLIWKFLLSRVDHTIEVTHPFKTFRICFTSSFTNDLPHRFEVFLETGICFHCDVVYNLSGRIINQLLLQINYGHILKQTMIAGHQLYLFGLLSSALIQPPQPHPHKQNQNCGNSQNDTIFVLLPERRRHHIKNRIRRAQLRWQSGFCKIIIVEHRSGSSTIHHTNTFHVVIS